MRRSRIVAVNGIPRPGTTGDRIRLAEAAVEALRLLILTGCRRDEILTLRRVRRRIARELVRWRRGADFVRTAARAEARPPARDTDTGRGGLPGQEPEARRRRQANRDGVGSRVDGKAMNSGLVCARTTPGIIDAMQVGQMTGRSLDGDASNRHECLHSDTTVLLGKPIFRGTGLSVQCLPGPVPGGWSPRIDA